MSTYNFYESKTLDAGLQMQDFERGEGYRPSEALIQAVNVALMLQKPLLLTGLPGTGKTELAYHLARRFGWGEVEFFATRTDSTATDLLYRYDSLAHFHKVNIDRGEGCMELQAADIEERYIHYVALGEAIRKSAGYKGPAQRTVVLIDEIDKAPRDLPNDILSIIERMEFEVPELKTATADESMYRKTGDPKLKPVVILTSNSEKSLPDAFLRRCVFFHIEMPDDGQLTKILLGKQNLEGLQEGEANEYIALFNDLKKLIRGKQPATHELILWVWWMRRHGFKVADLRDFNATFDKSAVLLSGISILAKETGDWKKVTEAVRNGQIPESSSKSAGQE